MKNSVLKNVSILCLDNYIDSLEILKLSLELHGARVFAAVSADEAIRIFDEHHPSILIADLALPQGDGISVLKAIRSRGPLPAAIALTGISETEVRKRALEAGFDRYLVKPVDDHVLLQAVSALALKGQKLSA